MRAGKRRNVNEDCKSAKCVCLVPLVEVGVIAVSCGDENAAEPKDGAANHVLSTEPAMFTVLSLTAKMSNCEDKACDKCRLGNDYICEKCSSTYNSRC
jgi:hypothetical protein